MRDSGCESGLVLRSRSLIEPGVNATLGADESAHLVYYRRGLQPIVRIDSAIERITEAEDQVGLPDDDRDQQHEVYEKTFRSLEDVTPDDNDEGITVVTDWIVQEILTNAARPTSRAVRRRARRYCEDNGYEVSNNDWLGI